MPLPNINLKRKVTPDEIEGTWVLTAQAKKMISKHSCSGTPPAVCNIVFLSDGTCIFHSVYNAFGPDLKYLRSQGKWKLEHDSNGNSNIKKKNALHLDMDSKEFYSNTYLNFTEKKGELLLWSFVGDPDSWQLITYQKKKDDIQRK